MEHDASEIWHNVQAVTRGALDRAGLSPADLAAIGITNQRETTLLWDAATGEPVGNAIVWQDTRTDRLIAELAGEHGQDRFRRAVRAAAGHVLLRAEDPLAARPGPGAAGAGRGRRDPLRHDGHLADRTLTGRHVTDVTNASRTMLMNLSTLDWDDSLLDAHRRAPGDAAGDPAVVPRVRGGRGQFGGVPVAGALGDQQAALFGQACFAPGEAKCTYGTGSFLLLNTGTTATPSERGLVTTVGYQIGDEPAVYALEGSIAVTGSLVQWLRDNLGLISAAPEVNDLAASVPDNGGCYVVPAFSGLFAPHWRSDARGVIAGLTGYVTKAHLARAALESTAWQVRDVVDAMNADSGLDLATLKVDGGMTASELLHAVPGRRARRAGGPAHGDRDHLPRRGLRGRPGRRLLARRGRAAGELVGGPALGARDAGAAARRRV